jgi:hypothetical protein
MDGAIRRAGRGRGLKLLVAGVLVALFLMPAAVDAWRGPGYTLDPIERQVLDLVNAERAKVGAEPLILNYSLQEAAWAHTKHMAEKKVLCHQGCGDGDPFSRIRATGYRHTTAGENVASGQRSSQAVMSDWMSSSGHKRNILSKAYTDIGIAFEPAGLYGTSWTQVFAAPVEGYVTITPPAGDPGGDPSLPTATPEPPAPCLLPDFNGDRTVTMTDVEMAGRRVNLRDGDEDWDATYDVVSDGVVNVYDVYAVLMEVGESCN